VIDVNSSNYKKRTQYKIYVQIYVCYSIVIDRIFLSRELFFRNKHIELWPISELFERIS